MSDSLTVTPIGFVRSRIQQTDDDVRGGVTSRIDLNRSRFTPEALMGLAEFSHVEVVFVFHRVDEHDVTIGARHPRGRPDWPLVGIFAQRAKNRPNRIGVTTCRLVAVRELTVEVEWLDAIDGTPVLDVKPYMSEFAPKGAVRQPSWSTELMSGYWRDAG